MKHLGDFFGIDVMVSDHVPDGKVYLMNKNMLESFTVNVTLTKWQKVKRYFRRLFMAIKGQL